MAIANTHLTYRDVRPVVMPDSLDQLCAHLDGPTVLPVRLDWSPRRVYDPSNAVDLVKLYVQVIQEASAQDDFRNYLDRDTLIRLWPTLPVGPFLERRWADRFPELPPRRNL